MPRTPPSWRSRTAAPATTPVAKRRGKTGQSPGAPPSATLPARRRPTRARQGVSRFEAGAAPSPVQLHGSARRGRATGDGRDGSDDDVDDGAEGLTAAEAALQAVAEGLTLELSSASPSGYAYVRQRRTGVFEAQIRAGAAGIVHIGTFGSAEEAALAVARRKRALRPPRTALELADAAAAAAREALRQAEAEGLTLSRTEARSGYKHVLVKSNGLFEARVCIGSDTKIYLGRYGTAEEAALAAARYAEKGTAGAVRRQSRAQARSAPKRRRTGGGMGAAASAEVSALVEASAPPATAVEPVAPSHADRPAANHIETPDARVRAEDGAHVRAAEGAMTVIECAVPDGHVAGTALHWFSPLGRWVELSVPDGARRGMRIRFEVPRRFVEEERHVDGASHAPDEARRVDARRSAVDFALPPPAPEAAPADAGYSPLFTSQHGDLLGGPPQLRISISDLELYQRLANDPPDMAADVADASSDSDCRIGASHRAHGGADVAANKAAPSAAAQPGGAGSSSDDAVYASGAEQAGENSVMMECIIPAGHVAGQPLSWVSPRGDRISFAIPEGARPGQRLRFAVPGDTSLPAASEQRVRTYGPGYDSPPFGPCDAEL